MKNEPLNLPKSFESRVQDLIYNVDVGVGNRLIKGAVFVLAVLALMGMYNLSQFWGLKHADAMDQAQIARELMENGTFSTRYIRPAAVWLFEKNGADPRTLMLRQPDIVHPPVHPWLISRIFKMTINSFGSGARVRVFPPEQWGVVPVGSISTLLTGLVVFLMARRFFERRIAITATAIYFLSDSVWANSISGLSVSLAGLFAVLTLYFALATAERVNGNNRRISTMLPALLTSVFGALALLTRYSAGWALVAALLVLGFLIPRKGWMIALAVAAGALLLASPWFIRNYQVCGSPFGLVPYQAFNLDETGVTYYFERQVQPSTEGLGQALRTNWMTRMARYYETAVPSIGTGLLVAFFVTAFFFRFSRPVVHLLRFALLAALVGLMATAGFFGDETLRTIAIFWPLVILYGLSFYYILLDRMQITIPIVRSALVGLVILLSALPLIFTLMPPRAGVPYPPYFPSYITLVTPMIQDDELLCTDMPWATAWYGNRSSYLLPATLDEFYLVNDMQRRISGIYFTTLTRDLPYVSGLVTGPYRSWYPIFREMIPVDFPLNEAFFIGNRDQLFLTDRPRWLQR